MPPNAGIAQQERWQSATRTLAERSKNGIHGLYEDAWGTFGGGGLAGFPPSIVRPSAFSSLPPPPPPPRPLTTVHRLERSQNAHGAFQRTFARTLQICDMLNALRNPLRSPTTTNGHQTPFFRPSTFIKLRSVTFS